MNAPGRSAEFDFPAEGGVPVTVVAGHGPLAGTTVSLLLLTMLAGWSATTLGDLPWEYRGR